MPRYFFHVQDGHDFPDTLGTELPDAEAARREAVHLVSQLLTHQPEEFSNGADWKMRVVDDHGLLMFTLQFTATMAPPIFTG